MFTKTTQYYDRIYALKNYAAEVERIRALLARVHPRARTILDVACGTAEHVRLLAEHYAVDGIDIEREFIAQARRKVPTGEFIVSDMRRFAIGKKYDVVQCLFSSIGYLTDEADVVRALRCFAAHLNPGGRIIVEPWITPDRWLPGATQLSPPVDDTDLKLVRMNTTARIGNLSLLNFHYLIATDNGVEYLQEDHTLALYSVDEMLSFFVAAGLDAQHEDEGLSGRGLYVAGIDGASRQV